jgi:hypothetical protein
MMTGVEAGRVDAELGRGRKDGVDGLRASHGCSMGGWRPNICSEESQLLLL